MIIRGGPLSAAQLRAGRSNALEVNALLIFGQGLRAGVSLVYTGTTPLVASGGYSRTLALAYPAMLGAPVTINRAQLPLIMR